MSILRHSLDELARLGDEFYDREVLPRTTEAQRGMYVAIDVDTGTFAIDANQLAAADQVRENNPEAFLWFRRVGRAYVHRTGLFMIQRSVVATDCASQVDDRQATIDSCTSPGYAPDASPVSAKADSVKL